MLSGITCLSLPMADWSLITVLVTCTLYQPVVLHGIVVLFCFVFLLFVVVLFLVLFSIRFRKKKGKRKTIRGKDIRLE